MYMRIQNKYLRNRHFRIKNWKRIRNTKHPFETHYCWIKLYSDEWIQMSSYEEQVKRHFDWIDIEAWGLESGANVFYNSPAGFRRMLNKCRKASERKAMAKIRQGDYEVEMPHLKKDANWLYF
jgi:hypothetical protein